MKVIRYTLFSLILLGTAFAGNAQVTQDFTYSSAEVTTSTQDNMDIVHLKKATLLNGEDYVGDPQLPMVSVKLALPKGQKAETVSITANQQTTLSGTFDIVPVPEPEYMNEVKEESTNLCQNEYTEAYPGDPVVNYENFQYRAYSYVIVNFIPFTYEQQTGKLDLLTEVTVSVNTTTGGSEVLTPIRAKDYTDQKAFTQMQQMVANPQQFVQDYTSPTGTEAAANPADSIFDGQFTPSDLPAQWGGEVLYVIITNNQTTTGESVGDLVSKFQEFADWKTRKGTPAKVVAVDTIKKVYQGVDTQEKIRNFIKDAHRKWKTENVLLGGAGSVIPARYMYWRSYPNKVVTDLYYAALEGNWNANGNGVFGEYSSGGNDEVSFDATIGVGRAPVHNEADVDNFIKKNLTYAQTVAAPQPIPNEEWLGKTLLGMGEALESGVGLGVGYEVITNNYGQTDFYGMFEYDENHVYGSDGILLGCEESGSWRKAYYPLHNTDCGNVTNDIIDQADLNHDAFLNKIEQGYGVINVFDHGLPIALSLGSVTNLPALEWNDFKGLTDTGKYGVFLATGCYSAPVDREQYIGEQWVNSAGGGLVYYGHSENIGASTGAINTENFFEVLLQDSIYNAADVMRLAAQSDEVKRISQLLGDPELSIYTTAPSSINVEHNYQNGMVLGQHDDVTISVDNTQNNIEPGQQALVSVYKPGEVSAYATGEAGTDFNFDITPDTEGQLYITVTSPNRKPYEDSITVLQPANKVHLYQNDITVNDENGNGIIEPGEEVDLNIQLHNTGGINATNISATLSSPEEHVEVTSANSTYADIASGATQVSATDFTFIAPATDTLRAIPFELQITTDQGEFKEVFLLDSKSANLEVIDRKVSANTGEDVNTFAPDEEVEIVFTVNNSGQMLAEEVTGKLTALDPGLSTVTTDSVEFGNIATPNETDNGNTPYKITIASSYNGTDSLKYVLSLTDKYGTRVKDTVNLTEDRPEQMGNNDFDYTATDHSIKPTWEPVSNFKDIQGYNLYWSDSEHGNYEKVNTAVIRGTSTYEHFDLDADTAYWYKIGVISPSGYERPIDSLQAHQAYTKIAFQEGFPVETNPSGIKGAHSSPTVYDVSGDGKKEIFVPYLNHNSATSEYGRIVNYDADGAELFKTNEEYPDQNWGFAGTGKELYAKIAVGDLEGDGQAEVIAAGRGHDVGDDKGSLYGYRTVDEDDDGKPDGLWEDGNKSEIEFETDHKISKSPVLADLNNDGYLEILVLDEYQTLHVYSHDGEAMGSYKIGNKKYSESEIAVADVDGDGFKEVFYGVEKNNNGKGALYKWSPKGDLSADENGEFSASPELFHEFDEEERPGGPVLADIDNDGHYEVLIITRKDFIGYVYALNTVNTTHNGDAGEALNCVDCHWNGNFTIQTSGSEMSTIPRMAVGDLNGNGKLEVVFGNDAGTSFANSKLYALNYRGEELNNFPIEEVASFANQTPVLANITGAGNGVDIVINNSYKNGSHVRSGIIAFDSNGERVPNVELELHKPQDYFVNSPYVGDVNGNGKNDIVASTAKGDVYIWNTEGDADKIEWGSYRHDAQNTAAYGTEACVFYPEEEIDLMIKDRKDDIGEEPNTISEHIWDGGDIWVRNQDDGELNHENQNPVYGMANYVYIRITNRGCADFYNQGNDNLYLHWAKANTQYGWPDLYNGNITSPTLMGDVMGYRAIPDIPAGESAIVKFIWFPPNPEDYAEIPNSTQHHFCFLARIVSPQDPMAYPMDSGQNNSYLNNNVANRNVTVIDYEDIQNEDQPGGTIMVGNIGGYQAHTFNFELKSPDSDEDPIWKEAEVVLNLDESTWNKWNEGGQKGENIKIFNNEKRQILIAGNQATLQNLTFNPGEWSTMNLGFNFLTRKITGTEDFYYNIVQKDADNGQTVGGEAYVIRRKPRDLFYAKITEEDPAGNVENDSVVLKAQTLEEPAIYNWYDEDGNLIHTGDEVTIESDLAEEYKLEVLAKSDGYKDYKHIDVENAYGLESITPNPSADETEIHYKINKESSSYLMITKSSGGVSENFMLNDTSSSIIVDVSEYSTGEYVVSLFSDGKLIDYKHLIIK